MSLADAMWIVFLAVAAIVVVGLMMRATGTGFKHFHPPEDHFPPISDAEFLAKCSPGTSPRVALAVRRMVAEHFAVPYERIHPNMRWIEDIGAD